MFFVIFFFVAFLYVSFFASALTFVLFIIVILVFVLLGVGVCRCLESFEMMDDFFEYGLLYIMIKYVEGCVVEVFVCVSLCDMFIWVVVVMCGCGLDDDDV